MGLSGSLAPAPRTCAAVGRIELREALSTPRQRQPSVVHKPCTASPGVKREARSTSPTSARAHSNALLGGELAIVPGGPEGPTSGRYERSRREYVTTYV